MPLPINRPLQEYNLECHLADITTSGGTAVAFTPVPTRGVITRVYAAQYNTATGGAAIITVAKKDGQTGNTVTVSGCEMTFSTTSGQAGRVYSAVPSHPLGSAAAVSEGDVLSFTSNGAPTDATVPATFTAIIRRG